MKLMAMCIKGTEKIRYRTVMPVILDTTFMLCKLVLGLESIEHKLAHTNPSANIKSNKAKILGETLFNQSICSLYCLTIHQLINLDVIRSKDQNVICIGLSGSNSTILNKGMLINTETVDISEVLNSSSSCWFNTRGSASLSQSNCFFNRLKNRIPKQFRQSSPVFWL